jgi:hypothetical protein
VAPTGVSLAHSAVGDRLGIAGHAIALPEALDAKEPASPATAMIQDEGDSDSRTMSSAPAAGPPATTRATRPAPKDKKRSAPDTPLAEQEPAPAPSASSTATAAPSASPTASVAASVAPTPVGMLIGHHRNLMGASLRLIKIVYVLDGNVVFSEEGDKLSQSRDFEAFRRNVSPSEHTVSVIAEFQGNGRGVFSYFDTYRYKAQSSHRFNVREGATTQLTVTLLEKSGPTTSFENRMAIGFKVN